MTLLPTLLTLLAGCQTSDSVARIEGTEAGDCTDRADDDADGLFDCDDDGCAGSPDCAGDSADSDTGDSQDSGALDSDTGDSTPSDTDTGDSGGDDSDTTPVWTVCDDGIAPYDSVQAAVDAAGDGDTISVCAGVWGGVRIEGKTLTLVGEDAATTILFDSTAAALDIEGFAAVDVSGFTLRGQADVGASSLQITDSDVHAHDLQFTEVSTHIVLEQNGGNCVFEDLLFDGVSTDSGGQVVTLTAPTGSVELRHSVFRNLDVFTVLSAGQIDAAIHNNIFSGITGGSYGVFGFGAYGLSNVFANNVIYDVTTGSGSLGSESGGTFVDNVIDSCGNGYIATSSGGAVSYSDVWESDTTELSGTGNLAVNPYFTDAEHGDFTLQPGVSTLIDAGDPAWTDADGSRADLGAFGGPDGDWTPPA